MIMLIFKITYLTQVVVVYALLSNHTVNDESTHHNYHSHYCNNGEYPWIEQESKPETWVK